MSLYEKTIGKVRDYIIYKTKPFKLLEKRIKEVEEFLGPKGYLPDTWDEGVADHKPLISYDEITRFYRDSWILRTVVDGIVDEILDDACQLSFVTDNVIVTFGLPEWALAAQDPVRLTCRVSLQRL